VYNHGGGAPTRTNQHRSPESVTGNATSAAVFAPAHRVRFLGRAVSSRGFMLWQFVDGRNVVATQRSPPLPCARSCSARPKARAQVAVGRCQDRRTRGRASGPDSCPRREARGVREQHRGPPRECCRRRSAISVCGTDGAARRRGRGSTAPDSCSTSSRNTGRAPAHGARAGIVRPAAASLLVRHCGLAIWSCSPEPARRISHVAIYVGRRRIIHATSSGRRVRYDALDTKRGSGSRGNLVASPTRLAARGIPRR
jgi:hypothetical protein